MATTIDGLTLTNTFDAAKVAPTRLAEGCNPPWFGCNGWGRIKFWLGGVTMTATVDVTAFDATDGNTWEVGFVQILEDSRMKAVYGKKPYQFVKEWVQPTLPCYDSTNDACIPWYTPHTDTNPDNNGEYSHATITGPGQFQLTLRDYPTSCIDPYLDNKVTPNVPNGMQPLAYYNKSNKFNVYLTVRKTSLMGIVEDTYLQHCRWSTSIEAEPRTSLRSQGLGLTPPPDAVGTNDMYTTDGYSVLKGDFSKSWCNWVITAYFHSLPNVTAASANDHIDDNQAPRKPGHELPVFIYAM
jgi:hypothetical protein